MPKREGKSKGASPTARTLEMLRGLGYTCAVVEQTVSKTYIKRDLFGCIDVVACRRDLNAIIGIQVTSTSNMQARVKKALAEPNLETWLQAGGRFLVIGWNRRSCAASAFAWKKGDRRSWEYRIMEINLEDYHKCHNTQEPALTDGLSPTSQSFFL